MLTKKGKRILKNGFLKGFSYLNGFSLVYWMCAIDGIVSWQPYAIMVFNAIWLWLFAYANGYVTDTKPYYERMARDYGCDDEDDEEPFRVVGE